jgi:hypothetical protein
VEPKTTSSAFPDMVSKIISTTDISRTTRRGLDRLSRREKRLWMELSRFQNNGVPRRSVGQIPSSCCSYQLEKASRDHVLPLLFKLFVTSANELGWQLLDCDVFPSPTSFVL